MDSWLYITGKIFRDLSSLVLPVDSSMKRRRILRTRRRYVFSQHIQENYHISYIYHLSTRSEDTFSSFSFILDSYFLSPDSSTYL